MFMVISLVLLLGTVQGNYKDIPYENSAGLYYEEVGTVKLYSTEWRIVTFLDLSHFFDQLDRIAILSEKVKAACRTDGSRMITCRKYLDSLDHVVIGLKEKQTDLQDFLGFYDASEPKSNRNKRGWFDGIGHVFQEIFGLVDNEDGERFDAEIEKLTKGERKTLELVKEQATIVSSTIQNFNDTVQHLNKNEAMINKNLKDIDDSMTMCKLIKNDYWICRQTQPVFLTHASSSCEVSLFLNASPIPETCDIRLAELTNPLWIQIQKQNK
ncbi:uncharacterized protein LOC125501494 [Athalia rosae]|uniref:uncharacterized protein LOC125501494 n=1 Tax=Athalia rosae TaxID=37344 RepID=UPI002033B26A|nr:uncharacterized protein LOC125501494 [Athalia rosae]